MYLCRGSRAPKRITQVAAPTTAGGLGCRLLLHHSTVLESVICNGYPQKVSGNENESFLRILTSPDICGIRESSPLLSKPFPNPCLFNPFSDPELSCNSPANPFLRNSSIPHTPFTLRKRDAAILAFTPSFVSFLLPNHHLPTRAGKLKPNMRA